MHLCTVLINVFLSTDAIDCGEIPSEPVFLQTPPPPKKTLQTDSCGLFGQFIGLKGGGCLDYVIIQTREYTQAGGVEPRGDLVSSSVDCCVR